jgi:hypothetical protein
MNLKKDIQVISFLIQKKIPFKRMKKHLKVLNKDIPPQYKGPLSNYEYQEKVYIYVSEKHYKPGNKKQVVRLTPPRKKPKIDFIKIEQEAELIEEKKPFQRPPAVYSNKSYNV